MIPCGLEHMAEMEQSPAPTSFKAAHDTIDMLSVVRCAWISWCKPIRELVSFEAMRLYHCLRSYRVPALASANCIRVWHKRQEV